MAPAYRIARESREVRFVSGEVPSLEIRSEFKLENTGTTELPLLDVALPKEEIYGRKNLRVQVNGRTIASAPPSAEKPPEDADVVRIPLDPPWKRKQALTLAIAYTLSAPLDSGARITIGQNEFHLGWRGWAARPLPPKHFIAPYPGRPARILCVYRVPTDFAVLSRGAFKGRKVRGSEAEYLYEVRKSSLAPFVVAGKYIQWPPRKTPHIPVFWTRDPLPTDPRPVAQQIAAAWTALENDFGSLGAGTAVPHIVEAPELRGHLGGQAGPAAAAFPGGALVNSQALALGISSDQFLALVTHALAHNWFGEEMYPSADAFIGMGEGLPEYATIVVDETQNGSAARLRRIHEYLRRYDEAAKHATEIPLGVIRPTDPAGARRIALAKAPLFFIAIEDACGEAPVRAGLARLAVTLRGQQVDYSALRAALEQSTGRELGKLFRGWLYGTGIPAHFRDRYPLASGTEETGE